MVSPSNRYHLVLALLLAGFAWTAGACDDDAPQSSEQADAASERDTSAPTAGDESASSSDAGESGGDGASQNPDRPSASSEQSGTITQKPPLEIDSYVTTDVLSKVVGGGSYQPTSLPGQKPSPTYNARRLQPSNGRGYGAGLQVWAFDQQKELESTFENLRSQYLNVEAPPQSADSLRDRAFLSERNGIRNVVFHLDEPLRIVAVSCGERTCGSADTLLKLARRIEERIVEQGDKQTGDGSSDSDESPEAAPPRKGEESTEGAGSQANKGSK